MTNGETKIAVRELIKTHCDTIGSYYRDVDPIRFLVKCPLCGDSSDPRHAHFYIIANPNDNMNIGYNCFKCGEHGALTPDILSAMGIDDMDIKSSLTTLNKTATKINRSEYNDSSEIGSFQVDFPEYTEAHLEKFHHKIAYLERRLNISYTLEDLKANKVILSLKEFLMLNHIDRYPFPSWVMNNLEFHYVGFLTMGNSHILLRDITGKEEISWVKYKIFPSSENCMMLYVPAAQVDTITTSPIRVNIAEGVMDVLGVKHNLHQDGENVLNMCIAGKHYERCIRYLLHLGIIGSNVQIHVYADNDQTFNKKAANPTTVEYFQRVFRNLQYLFGDIYIHYNLTSKDYGVPKEYIMDSVVRL